MFKRLQPHRCYIIAEIGGNFTTADIARRLIDAAADCGVDAVKLQTYRADTLASRRAIFDMENTGVRSQHELFRQYEIGESLHRDIFAHAERRGLDWFSTPSHATDVDLLNRLGVGCHKIGSDDATNLPFLRYVAEQGKPVILSTGMCTLAEVQEAVDTILATGNAQLALLHAITSYPTHPPDVNLRAMITLQRAFPNLPVGYSDHTLGPWACVAAVALGARIIEKHFTLDKQAPDPDAMLSADVPELRQIVEGIRAAEQMLGSGEKVPAAGESITRVNNRKSLVLAVDVRQGQPIAAEHLAIKRPGTGIPPRHWGEVIGRAVRRDLQADEVLRWDDLQ